MFESLNREADFAIDAVRSAAMLLRAIQDDPRMSAVAKEDLSPVTAADYAAQALIVARLNETFPEDGLLAEEQGSALRRAPASLGQRVLDHVRRARPQATHEQVLRWLACRVSGAGRRWWALDPLDGTKGFLRGGQYAVALALIEAGHVLVAALGCPRWSPKGEEPGRLLIAARGEGAWQVRLEGGELSPLSVSGEHRPQHARLLFSFEPDHTDEAKMAGILSALGSGEPPLRMDSQVKYAALAAGEGELVIRLPPAARPDRRDWIWDHAAGSLIVEEAGGAVSDLRGRPLTITDQPRLPDNWGILATNRHLHAAALAAIEAVGADQRPFAI